MKCLQNSPAPSQSGYRIVTTRAFLILPLYSNSHRTHHPYRLANAVLFSSSDFVVQNVIEMKSFNMRPFEVGFICSATTLRCVVS